MRTSFLFLFLVVFLALGFSFAPHTFAAEMNYVSDTITDSRPSTTADHAIVFQVPDAIPPSGSIVMGFENQPFLIDPAFDYTAVDLAYSTSSPTSGFTERSLADSPDATDDGVFGDAPTGPVTITLSSGSGIPAGAYVRVLFDADDITNPSSSGEYRILMDTYGTTSTLIDYGATVLTILPSVGVDANEDRIVPAVLSDGLPSGTIPSNVSGVLLSLDTDVFATCRYATSSGVSYDSMTNELDATSLGTFHTATVVMTIVNGTTYNFYVRCEDFAGNKNPTDYVISFTGGEPTGTGLGGGSGGSGGGGGGGGGGVTYPPYPPGPSSPSLIIQGIALPGSKIQMLQDGTAISQSATADGEGNFSIDISSLAQGTYSFTLYIDDNNGNRISSRTITMTVIAGTANSVQGIVMPPSLTLATSSVPVGGTVAISGFAEPSSTVSLSITSQSGAQSAVNVTTQASQSGAWSYTLPTTGFAVDTYQVVAESSVPGLAVSGLSTIAYLGVGTSPEPLTANPDLNHDGKVNLVDFSILLFHWGQAWPPGDFNHDGVVDLPDLSIMLFHWTG